MLRDIFFCIGIFFLYRRERGGGGARIRRILVVTFWSSFKALLYSGNPTSLAVNFYSPPRSISVSGQLPTYPSPNPTLTLTRYQLTVVELGEGTMFETTDPWYGWSTNSTGRNLMNTTNTKVVLLITLLESHPGWCINLRASYSLKMLHRVLNLKFLLTSGWE